MGYTSLQTSALAETVKLLFEIAVSTRWTEVLVAIPAFILCSHAGVQPVKLLQEVRALAIAESHTK